MDVDVEETVTTAKILHFDVHSRYSWNVKEYIHNIYPFKSIPVQVGKLLNCIFTKLIRIFYICQANQGIKISRV